jgi:hypothetical protein
LGCSSLTYLPLSTSEPPFSPSKRCIVIIIARADKGVRFNLIDYMVLTLFFFFFFFFFSW